MDVDAGLERWARFLRTIPHFEFEALYSALAIAYENPEMPPVNNLSGESMGALNDYFWVARDLWDKWRAWELGGGVGDEPR